MTSPCESFVAPRRARRLWLWAILVAFAAMGAAAAFLLFYDIPLPADADMRPRRTLPSSGTNPLDDFIKARSVAPRDDYQRLPLKVKSMAQGQDEEISKFLKRHEPSLKAFDVLMKSDVKDWRVPVHMHPHERDLRMAARKACDSIANCIRLRAHLESSDSTPAASARTCIDLIRYASGVEQAESSLSWFLITSEARRLGREGLEHALIKDPVTPELLVELQSKLIPLEPKLNDARYALQADYEWRMGWYSDLKKGHAQMPDPRDYGRLAPLGPQMIKLGLTHASVLAQYRPLMSALELDWKAVQAAERDVYSRYSPFYSSNLRVFCHPNAVGNDLVRNLLREVPRQWSEIAANAALHRQTVLMLAMRRYDQDRGHPPAALEDLVPKYMDGVPQDPFDNLPMRWNATTKTIYSVGFNLKDDGDKVVKPGTMGSPDIGLCYWWSDEGRYFREGAPRKPGPGLGLGDGR